MKKIMFFMAAMLMAGCYYDREEMNEVGDEESVEVTLTFMPYEMEAMTRTATSIGDYCTRLDVWISDGTTQIDAHQTSTDDDFGTLSLALNKTKTYSLIAVAHKCSDVATLADGILSFAEDKVTHSMIYVGTFSPGTSTSQSFLMNRIVGQFRLEIADVVPNEVTKFDYIIKDTYNQWDVTQGEGVNLIDRTGTINLTSRNQDGGVTLNIFVIPTDLTTTDHFDVTMTARNAQNEVVESRTFENVPIKAGYRTTYHGTFFVTSQMTMSFVADDWQSFNTVEY